MPLSCLQRSAFASPCWCLVPLSFRQRWADWTCVRSLRSSRRATGKATNRCACVGFRYSPRVHTTCARLGCFVSMSSRDVWRNDIPSFKNEPCYKMRSSFFICHNLHAFMWCSHQPMHISCQMWRRAFRTLFQSSRPSWASVFTRITPTWFNQVWHFLSTTISSWWKCCNIVLACTQPCSPALFAHATYSHPTSNFVQARKCHDGNRPKRKKRRKKGAKLEPPCAPWREMTVSASSSNAIRSPWTPLCCKAGNWACVCKPVPWMKNQTCILEALHLGRDERPGSCTHPRPQQHQDMTLIFLFYFGK